MKILAKTKRVLVLLVSLAALSSCVKEILLSDNGGEPGKSSDAEVSVVVRVPGNSAPATKALGEETHDAEVNEVVVLQFTQGQTDPGQNILKFVSKSDAAPEKNGNTLTFKVKLITGNYNIVVLANSNGIYDAVRDDEGDLRGRTYNDIQGLFTKAVKGSNGEGDKWNTDPTDPKKGYVIPMWGKKDDVLITLEEGNQIVQTVHLYRMLAKVDVTVQRTAADGYSGVPLTDFRLTYVSYHNYNRTGLIMPGLAKGDWEAQNGVDRKAHTASLLPTEDKVTGHTHCQAWTTMTEPNNALKGEIFTFEASAGTDYSDRACVIIGGYYNWDGNGTAPAMCYYRVDMTNASGQHLEVLRNFKYNVIIRKVKGAGYPTVEEAYRSKPTNITADVIPWNDGEYTEGIWEGMNEISFTSRTAHFTQFGTPANQIFKVRTTADELKFSAFRSGPVDNNSEVFWEENPAGSGKWSNGHFTIEISGPTTSGGYTEHQIEINAAPTAENNGERKAYFKVTALNLEATFTIVQDKHVTYRLVTDPAPNHVFVYDGNQQYINVKVESTHPYIVDWDNHFDSYFGEIQLEPSGSVNKGTPIDPGCKSVKILLEGLPNNVGLRASEFYIEHDAGTGSNVSPADFTVIQKKPIILASLVAGEPSELQKEGGSVKIKVESNMNSWKPVLKIGNNPPETNIFKYFGISGGSGDAEVTFTAEAMDANETVDKVFTITFKDANGDTESTPPIIITQIAKLPGSGSGSQQPGSGMDAIPGILAVNSKGQLNLDGDGYLVYFKYGSLIATWSRTYGDHFDRTDVAWTPDGFDYDELMLKIGNKTKTDAWAYIPYAGDPYCNMSDKPGVGWVIGYEGYPDYPAVSDDNIALGLGDPCKYAYAKSGKKYRTPKGGNGNSIDIEYDMPLFVPPINNFYKMDNAYGIDGRWYNKGLPDAQFYPAGGVRNSYDGYVDRPGSNYTHYTFYGGFFWCSGTETPGGLGTNRGSAMRNKLTYVDLRPLHARNYGYLVRCMEDK